MGNNRMPNRPQEQTVINLFERLTESDNYYSIKMMLEANVLLAIMPNKNGTMPLEIAELEGDKDVVNLIKAALSQIEKKWPEIHPDNIDKIDKDKNTPLTLAIENNDLEKVKLLLSYGADPNKKDGFGISPIVIAYQMSENKKNDRWEEIFEAIMQHEKHVASPEDMMMIGIIEEQIQKSGPKPIQAKEEKVSATVHKVEEIDVTAKIQAAQKSTEPSETVLPDAKKAKILADVQRAKLSLQAAKDALDINDVKLREIHPEDQMSGEELMKEYNLFEDDREDMYREEKDVEDLLDALDHKNPTEESGEDLLEKFGLNDPKADPAEETGEDLLEKFGLNDPEEDPTAKKLPRVRTAVRAEIKEPMQDPAQKKLAAQRQQRVRGPLPAVSMPEVKPAQRASAAADNDVRNDNTAREEISHQTRPKGR